MIVRLTRRDFVYSLLGLVGSPIDLILQVLRLAANLSRAAPLFEPFEQTFEAVLRGFLLLRRLGQQVRNLLGVGLGRAVVAFLRLLFRGGQWQLGALQMLIGEAVQFVRHRVQFARCPRSRQGVGLSRFTQLIDLGPDAVGRVGDLVTDLPLRRFHLGQQAQIFRLERAGLGGFGQVFGLAAGLPLLLFQAKQFRSQPGQVPLKLCFERGLVQDANLNLFAPPRLLQHGPIVPIPTGRPKG